MTIFFRVGSVWLSHLSFPEAESMTRSSVSMTTEVCSFGISACWIEPFSMACLSREDAFNGILGDLKEPAVQGERSETSPCQLPVFLQDVITIEIGFWQARADSEVDLLLVTRTSQHTDNLIMWIEELGFDERGERCDRHSG